MADERVKGPAWGLLAVLLFAGLMRVNSLLHLPENLTGAALRTVVLAVGFYAILTVCVKRLPPVRFFAWALPLMFIGNTVWPLFLRRVSSNGQESVVLFSAVLVGAGLGGMITVWIFQGRRAEKQGSGVPHQRIR